MTTTTNTTVDDLSEGKSVEVTDRFFNPNQPPDPYLLKYVRRFIARRDGRDPSTVDDSEAIAFLKDPPAGFTYGPGGKWPLPYRTE